MSRNGRYNYRPEKVLGPQNVLRSKRSASTINEALTLSERTKCRPTGIAQFEQDYNIAL